MLPKQVLVFIFIWTGVIRETVCSTFHVAFLGTNASSVPSKDSPVGALFLKTAGKAPIITSKFPACHYNDTATDDFGTFTTTTFKAPGCVPLIPNGIEHAESGVRVESPDEVIMHVIQSSSTGVAGDGYLAIPDEHLGNEYYVITYCSTGGSCQFAVAGIIDNTTVDIIFPDNALTGVVCVDGIPFPMNAPNGTAIPFTVDEYEVLHFESDQDLTGTYIYSNMDVAVFVGTRDVPNAHDREANMIEQIPPVNKWGREFVIAPNYLNPIGDLIKIVTKNENTAVHISGFSPFTISKRGGSAVRRIDWQMHSRIITSKPVLIIQLMNIDLYNNTNGSSAGLPVMVIVQHKEQWTDTDIYFQCFSIGAELTLVSVAASSTVSASIPALPVPVSFYALWTTVTGTEYDVMMFKPSGTETTLTGPARGAYGYCEGIWAFLLDANWEWENELCVPTAVTQGDGRDNNCNGEIDEHDCTTADLEIHFTSEQTINGDVTYKSGNIRGAGYINFSVCTCDVALVSLRTNTEPRSSITIKMSTNYLVEEICVPDCYSASSYSLNTTDCSNVKYYSIEWFEDSTGLRHMFHTSEYMYSWDIDNIFNIHYDEMVVAALVGTADFVIGLPEKDCKKVIETGFADSLGMSFMIPITDADYNFSIYLSTKNDIVSMVTMELNVAHLLGTIELSASETVVIMKEQISETSYAGIRVTATGGEVSVYLVLQTTAITGLSILPTGILSPTYQLFVDGSVITGKVCDVFPLDRSAISNGGDIYAYSHSEITVEPTAGYNHLLKDYGNAHLLVADRPVAVVCGTFEDTMVQMPPRETLGTTFYVPKIDLNMILADAELHVIVTEDSTTVIIKGDYDQMDPVDLAGDIYIRHMVSNTIYSIIATKPVQVLLKVRSVADTWASAVVIPPIKQYMTHHVFPGFDPLQYEVIASSAVDLNGTDVNSEVSMHTIAGVAVTYTYTGPVFSLTTMQIYNTDSKFIVASDVRYDDINEGCTLTTGYPGDGIDNDCDSLVDEEQCSDSTTPGNIDYDIDGSLNEDCAANTSATTPSVDLSIPTSMITCRANITTGGSTDIIIITSTVSTSRYHTVPDIPMSGTDATFEAHTPTVAITIVTTTPAPGSTAAPVETCTTACVCPCGWVNPPQNYTKEELASIIVEIQEKLAVTKAVLSTTVRKKTSATDDRPSATAVGFIGLAFLIVTICSIMMLDVTALLRDLRMLVDNVGQVFKS